MRKRRGQIDEKTRASPDQRSTGDKKDKNLQPPVCGVYIPAVAVPDSLSAECPVAPGADRRGLGALVAPACRPGLIPCPACAPGVPRRRRGAWAASSARPAAPRPGRRGRPVPGRAGLPPRAGCMNARLGAGCQAGGRSAGYRPRHARALRDAPPATAGCRRSGPPRTTPWRPVAARGAKSTRTGPRAKCPPRSWLARRGQQEEPNDSFPRPQRSLPPRRPSRPGPAA